MGPGNHIGPNIGAFQLVAGRHVGLAVVTGVAIAQVNFSHDKMPFADGDNTPTELEGSGDGYARVLTGRAQGRTFAVGESTCLRTASGPRVAECGMVLNNTSWEFTERSCPES